MPFISSSFITSKFSFVSGGQLLPSPITFPLSCFKHLTLFEVCPPLCKIHRHLLFYTYIFSMNLLSSFAVLSPSTSLSYIFSVLSPTPKSLPPSLPQPPSSSMPFPAFLLQRPFSPIFFAMQNQTSFHVASLPCSSLLFRNVFFLTKVPVFFGFCSPLHTVSLSVTFSVTI